MSEDQKNLLLYGFLERPLDYDVHVSYNTKAEAILNDDIAENLTKVCGYTPAQIRRIRMNLEIANKETNGYNQ